MKRLVTALTVLALFALLAAPALATETYKVDPVHSSVEFKIRHLVGKAAGRFDDYSGTIVVDRDDLTKSSVEFSVVMASIDTDNENRDEHLRSEEFFDGEKHPHMTFKSSKIVKTGDMMYDVTGQFELHGVTKEITIPVEVLGFGPSPWGKGAAGFETSFTINRKDYGIVWNKALDAGGFVLGDDVDVEITIEAGEE